MDGTTRDARVDGRSAWLRLALTLAMVTVGGVGMWSAVVALPAVQAEYGIGRATASIPYSALMLGLAAGGVGFGRVSDRFGIVPAALGGGVLLGLGFLAAALSPGIVTFTAAHALLIGPGSSASFGPLIADISFWFRRRRGVAVAVAASGNYLAGALWPSLVQAGIAGAGWRITFAVLGAVCLVTLVPLALVLTAWGSRPASAPPNAVPSRPAPAASTSWQGPLSGGTVQGLLVVAGLGCCVAMAMPQVHIVAYCGDLGYGPARGAEMLSLMLGFGIVSRIASGFVADRIGGLPTLLAGSMLQGLALTLYLMFDSLPSLYVVSILFGLFQGGIVPSYAIIVRELFRPGEAGARIGTCIAATLIGMALGGAMSGWIFDRTGSYAAAFVNGIAWNLLNGAIVVFLITRLTSRPAQLRPAHA